MKRLILVAGPSCAGKTTFIAGIFACNPHLLQLLGISNLEEWLSLEARQLDKVNIREINNLVLHYDLLLQHDPAAGYRHIWELFAEFEDIIIITLVASPFHLLLRNSWRLLYCLHEVIFRKTVHKRNKYNKLFSQWNKEKVYLRRGSSKSVYQHWLEYTTGLRTSKNLLFDTSGISLKPVLNLHLQELKPLPPSSMGYQLP